VPQTTIINSSILMKMLLIAALAISSLGFAAPHAEAGSYRRSTSCAPYKVRTCEIGRRAYCQTAYDRCGGRYHYTVTVVTYRDSYSDGSARTFSRTYRS